jgi:hypothetical protein
LNVCACGVVWEGGRLGWAWEAGCKGRPRRRQGPDRAACRAGCRAVHPPVTPPPACMATDLGSPRPPPTTHHPQSLPLVLERKLEPALPLPVYSSNTNALRGSNAVTKERPLCKGGPTMRMRVLSVLGGGGGSAALAVPPIKAALLRPWQACAPTLLHPTHAPSHTPSPPVSPPPHTHTHQASGSPTSWDLCPMTSCPRTPRRVGGAAAGAGAATPALAALGAGPALDGHTLCTCKVARSLAPSPLLSQP